MAAHQAPPFLRFSILLCARPGDQRGIDMVSVPGERAGEVTAGTQTKWSILSAGGAVAQCLPGRLIRKAS